jgi:L-amino acid N-acyltransferase YncA
VIKLLKPRKTHQVDISQKYVYIKLKLPISKVTNGLISKLNQKIRSNYVRPKIKLATEEDLPRVANIYNRAWLTANTPFRQMTSEQFKPLFYNAKYRFFIAQVYGRDAGFLIICYEGQNYEYGVLVGLGINPQFQRKGVGTALALRAWQIFNMRSIKEIRCEIFYENFKSLSFAKSVGFEEYDMTVNYIEAL